MAKKSKCITDTGTPHGSIVTGALAAADQPKWRPVGASFDSSFVTLPSETVGCNEQGGVGLDWDGHFTPPSLADWGGSAGGDLASIVAGKLLLYWGLGLGIPHWVSGLVGHDFLPDANPDLDWGVWIYGVEGEVRTDREIRAIAAPWFPGPGALEARLHGHDVYDLSHEVSQTQQAALEQYWASSKEWQNHREWKRELHPLQWSTYLYARTPLNNASATSAVYWVAVVADSSGRFANEEIAATIAYPYTEIFESAGGAIHARIIPFMSKLVKTAPAMARQQNGWTFQCTLAETPAAQWTEAPGCNDPADNDAAYWLGWVEFWRGKFPARRSVTMPAGRGPEEETLPLPPDEPPQDPPLTPAAEIQNCCHPRKVETPAEDESKSSQVPGGAPAQGYAAVYVVRKDVGLKSEVVLWVDSKCGVKALHVKASAAYREFGVKGIEIQTYQVTEYNYGPPQTDGRCYRYRWCALTFDFPLNRLDAPPLHVDVTFKDCCGKEVSEVFNLPPADADPHEYWFARQVAWVRQ